MKKLCGAERKILHFFSNLILFLSFFTFKVNTSDPRKSKKQKGHEFEGAERKSCNFFNKLILPLILYMQESVLKEEDMKKV